MNSVIQNCTIPLPDGSPLPLAVEAGRSIIIIGANGAGKTRLGVHLEHGLGEKVQRIAAQKSLTLNDRVPLIGLERAEKTLRYGHADVDATQKLAQRWHRNPAIHPLNDFDALLQSLFAEHNRHASDYLQRCKADPDAPIPVTKLERIKTIWDALLPHRILEVFESVIKVRPVGTDAESYSGAQMSDGERAIFYFLGQSFMAPANNALIVDEPEGHIHKAIVGPLWDAIEQARPDCGFVYITHDLDFAVTRPAAAKYFVRSYMPPASRAPERWEIAPLPEDTGLPEHVVAELAGSRKPVLFAEGDRDSLDVTIYRHQYAKFTVVPIGSCEAVIHSVGSYNRSPELHRFDAKGIVDADDRGEDEISALAAKGVHVLPVAEIENLLLLPDVFTALAEGLHCENPAGKLAALTQAVMTRATAELERASARYATRQLDRRLKRVTVEAIDLATLEAGYQSEIAPISPAALFNDFKERLGKSIAANDLASVLRLYDNKGLLALAATTLDINPKAFMEKVKHLLATDAGKRLVAELTKVLPAITP